MRAGLGFVSGEGGSPVSSWTFVGKTDSTTGSIAVHGSAQAGDIAILYDTARNSSGAPSTAFPTDFTPFVDDTVSAVRTVVSAKILDGSESSLTGMDGTSADAKMLVVFRANAPLTSFAINDLEEFHSSNDPPTRTVNASGVTEALVVLCAAMCNSGTVSYSNINSNPDFDADLTMASSDILVGYKIYNSSPVNHTFDANDGGLFNSVVTFYLTGTV